jgi:CBS domain containing-hemolysin-like protein
MFLSIFALVCVFVLVAFRSAKLGLFQYSDQEIAHRQKSEPFFDNLSSLRKLGPGVVVLWTFFEYLCLILLIVSVMTLITWTAGVLASVAVVWVVLELVVPRYATTLSKRSLSWLAKPTEFVVKHIKRPLARFAKFARISYKKQFENIYTRAELVSLLDSHQHSPYSDIELSEVAIAKSALVFGDKKISDIMTPSSVVKLVLEHDMLTPHYLDDLYKSGFSRFPVVSGSGESREFVGTLFAKDLLHPKEGKSVANMMSKNVYYVNSSGTLGHAYQAFMKTKAQQYLVVNEFEEFVGLLTLEDVVEQILGKPIVDEFDQYEDMRAVTRLKADQVAKKRKKMIELPHNETIKARI